MMKEKDHSWAMTIEETALKLLVFNVGFANQAFILG